jgi:sodium transport system permease protein
MPANMAMGREILVLYRREVRSALRERTIVVNSILVPIFLYPFLLWVTISGLTFVRGQTEDLASRVAVRSWPADRVGLERELTQEAEVQLVHFPPSRGAAEALVRAGDLDAVLECLPPATPGLEGDFQVRIVFDESKERSAVARDRVSEAIDRYRDAWLKREAAALAVEPAGWSDFAVERRNVASGQDMGRFILGLMLPLFFVIMVAIGCFYPAVDATAGERERGTWETLMSVAASRRSIVASKYLFVATFGCLAGALNLTAVTLTMRPVLAPLMARTGEQLEFGVPLGALPIMLLSAVLLAGFVAAGMMLFASFARTFREGQSMVQPFYMMILLPVLFLQTPGIRFSTALALVPVVNVTMMVREAVTGVFHWPQIGLTMVVSVATVLGCIALATYILGFEDVLVGSYSGSLVGFVRDRLLKRGRNSARATEGRA